MLQEAIEKISQLATEAHEIEVFRVPGSPHTSYFRIGDELREVIHSNPDRKHVCLDLESLGRWVAAWAGADDQVVTWYGFAAVEAVLNDQTYRDDRVRMPLTLHPKFNAAITGAKSVDQMQLIKWIRQNLRQEFTKAQSGFEALVRRLKFSKGGGGQGSVEHGKESFSQEVLAEVTGATDIPEEIVLRVPVWEELEVTVELTLGVYIDAHDAVFSLLPLTGEVVRAKNDALRQLQSMVEEHCKDGEIYRGSES